MQETLTPAYNGLLLTLSWPTILYPIAQISAQTLDDDPGLDRVPLMFGPGGATLKTPYRDGTTHIVLEPLDFMARLAALVPKPRVNLTRFHGVFAPNSALRKQITPKARCEPTAESDDLKSPAQRRAAMTGFRSCKAGIHAIHGNILGTTPQTRVHQQ